MSATVIRSPQDFLNALKTIPANPPAIPQPESSFAPLTLEQVNAKLDEFSLALESPLPDPVRADIERRRAELVKEQFRLIHGYIPDADGNNPAEVKDIVDVATAAATKSVIDTLAAAPKSSELELDPEDEEEEGEEDEEGEEFDLDAQVEDLNETDEADAAVVVSPSEPMTIPAPVPGVPWATDGIFLPADVVSALRASMVANLPHITAHILTLVLGK